MVIVGQIFLNPVSPKLHLTQRTKGRMRFSRLKPYISLILSLCALAGPAWPEPVDLPDALRLALEHNPEIAAARQDIRGAEGDAALANAAASPYLFAGNSYTYLSKATVFGGQEVFKKTTNIQSLGLRQSIWDESLNRNRRAAGRAVDAREYQASAVEERVLYGVAERFWQVGAAREYVQAAEDAAAFLEANLKSVVASREAGIATRGDVLRAEAELALARDRLISARNGEQMALAALKAAIGLLQEYPLEVVPVQMEPNAAILTLEPGESPMVLAARAAAESRRQALSAAGAGNLPKVTLEADYLNISQGAEFPRTDGSASVLVRVSIPIFDGGMTRAASTRADADLKRAEKELENAVLQTQLHRKTAELALESARERYIATEKQVESAMESRRLTEIGYREGVNTQTDLLAAQSAVTMAQASRIQSLSDLKTAEAAYLTAISRLDAILNTGKEILP